MIGTDFQTATQKMREHYDYYYSNECREDPYNFMHPDRERLRYNIRQLANHRGYELPRRSGRTIAICYMMMWETKVKNWRSDYLCISHTRRMVDNLVQDFSLLCEYNDIRFRVGRVGSSHHITIGDKIIYFSSTEDIEKEMRNLRGIGKLDKIWADLSAEELNRRHEQRIHDYVFNNRVLVEDDLRVWMAPPLKSIRDTFDQFSHEHTRLYY